MTGRVRPLAFVPLRSSPCVRPLATGSRRWLQYTRAAQRIAGHRLSSGWNGGYSYGDAAHLHAVTAIGTGYTASYDAAGDMTCRAATSSSTCAGSRPTGAQLGYDGEGRLVSWQNAPTNPTQTAKYLYDGEPMAHELASSRPPLTAPVPTRPLPTPWYPPLPRATVKEHIPSARAGADVMAQP